MYFRPLPILSIFTALTLWLLLSLGNWQWQRYNFKLTSENSAPVKEISLESALLKPENYTRVYIDGTYGKKYIAINIAENGKYGKRIFTNLVQNNKNYCAEIGFYYNTSFKESGLKLGEKIKANGVIKLAKKPNEFFPDNNLATKTYYYPDCEIIAKDLGVDFEQNFYFTPNTIDPDMNGKSIQNPYADVKGISYIEPARHLGYALTWWGLSISLVLFYLALHFKQNRLGISKK